MSRLLAFGTAWDACQTLDTEWADEKCVKLKEFFRKVGLKEKVTHVSKVISANAERPLRWKDGEHYGRGRNPQGGGIGPYVVKRSALKAYYDHGKTHGF